MKDTKIHIISHMRYYYALTVIEFALSLQQQQDHTHTRKDIFHLPPNYLLEYEI